MVVISEDGGELTLEILQHQFPYMGFEDPIDFLEWFLKGDSEIAQLWIKQDDGNYFLATVTPEVAEKLIKEGDSDGD
jgi:hypothetical protein